MKFTGISFSMTPYKEAHREMLSYTVNGCLWICVREAGVESEREKEREGDREREREGGIERE